MSDWISQAEAARIRGVTRQAIAKLVKQGRLRTLAVGGRTLVSRTDAIAFEPRSAGRPKKTREMRANNIVEIRHLLKSCSREERYEIFKQLRQEFSIHPLETDWNIQAEILLEAISQASDLTVRGIKGIIAQAAFAVDIVKNLEGWTDVTQYRRLSL